MNNRYGQRAWDLQTVQFCASVCFLVLLTAPLAFAQTPTPVPDAPPPPLTLEATVCFALANNPQLAALRQQHGIAAAGIVIARTYPYNPITQSTLVNAKGSDPAVDLLPIAQQHKITLDVEVRCQRSFRKQAAFAALSRTDWEIAYQEVTFAVNAIRAFDTLLYRQQKLAVAEEFLRLNEKSAEQVKQLVDRGTLRAGDLILARAEVRDVQTQIGLNRTNLVSARRDFARALGVPEYACFALQGTLERTAPPGGCEGFLEAALEHRPDLFARKSAVAEAEARLRLQIADRFGNPTVGPVLEFDESRTRFIGAQVGFPIPVFNHRPGEIQQRRAEVGQALLYLRQTEVEIQQDVPAAVARVAEAADWVRNYQTQVLPDLQKYLDEMERLFQQGQPGVDVLRVLDVRRRLLRARDGYLDALLSYTQALSDLALAVGDPALAMGLYSEPEAQLKPACP
jgi:cobalt-zinc-cadmium efflux system outer membrane protein